MEEGEDGSSLGNAIESVRAEKRGGEGHVKGLEGIEGEEG